MYLIRNNSGTRCGRLKRRNNVCVNADGGKVSAAAQLPEETLVSCPQCQDFHRVGKHIWHFRINLLYHQICAHEETLNKTSLWKQLLQHLLFFQWSSRTCSTAYFTRVDPITTMSPVSLKKKKKRMNKVMKTRLGVSWRPAGAFCWMKCQRGLQD